MVFVNSNILELVMNRIVGKVQEIWRYPVKSMGGELLDAGVLEPHGLRGDRGWIVRDEVDGENKGVRQIPQLLQCQASYQYEPTAKQVPPVNIILPDGSSYSSTDSAIAKSLTQFLGRPVTLWPKQPKSNLRHYRLKKMMNSRELKRQFASNDVVDLSEISLKLLLELAFFSTPLGHYYDVYPLHILTTSSLKHIKSLEPDGDFVTKRFRPNILIETADDITGFAEFLWCGGTLTIGEVVIKCEIRTVRCSMPAREQPDLGKAPKTVKALTRHSDRHLGIYATVVKTGEIKVGDAVAINFPRTTPAAKLTAPLTKEIKRHLFRQSLKLADFLGGKKP